MDSRGSGFSSWAKGLEWDVFDFGDWVRSVSEVV